MQRLVVKKTCNIRLETLGQNVCLGSILTCLTALEFPITKRKNVSILVLSNAVISKKHDLWLMSSLTVSLKVKIIRRRCGCVRDSGPTQEFFDTPPSPQVGKGVSPQRRTCPELWHRPSEASCSGINLTARVSSVTESQFTRIWPIYCEFTSGQLWSKEIKLALIRKPKYTI